MIFYEWLILVGLFLVTFIFFILIVGIIKKQATIDWLEKIEAKQRKKINLSNSIQAWLIKVEQNSIVPKFLRITPIYILSASLLSVGLFIFGFFYLNNLPAAILLFIVGLAFPQQMIIRKDLIRQEKILEQLGTAVRIFAAEYADTPQTFRAISNTADRLQEPMAGIFLKAKKDFLAGLAVDDVMLGMYTSLKTEYGKMFVQLLRLSAEDEATKPLFLKLAMRISSQQDLIRRNRKEVTADRIVSALINGMIIPTFLIINYIVPEAFQFFTHTSLGKGIVVISIVSIMSGMILDIFATRGVTYE
ncbi:MAG: hypothetical protein GX295_11785 [Syntrophomonadaceae bacterium]|nr:hypothetical protein [Syntrophomonadaceae bacterium]